MKRMILFAIVLLMIIPIAGHSENPMDEMIAATGVNLQYASIGNRLIFIGDYDEITSTKSQTSDLIQAQFKEILKDYTSVIFLLVKDGGVYLGIEIPLMDGETIEGTGLPLMSTQFLQENLQFGTGSN